jgi:2-desacetyl-2-hydroxyethyl bacteriochlorophyllide A dehydrogenase
MQQEAQAFWITAPGHGEIRSEALRAAAEHDVVVRALFSGISRGTEALVFGGKVPESEWERMRAPFQAGDFPGPVKYGYASVGVVEQGPRNLAGRHVFVLHPHQTRYVVPADAAHVIPDNVPPSRAVLAANMETALNGLWDARPHLGDRIIVVGGGTVGCLAAWLAGRMPGCTVELVDINPRRASSAAAMGVRFATPRDATREADLVLHASGSPSGLELALELAAFEATVVELSWFGSQVVPLPLGRAFHSKRLTIRSSQVGHVAATQRSRWNTRRRMELAMSFLAHAELEALITGESGFESLPRVLRDLASQPGDALCHRIRY